MRAVAFIGLILLLALTAVLVIFRKPGREKSNPAALATGNASAKKMPDTWTPPDINQLENNAEGKKIRYGRDLIANTSVYFGPRGSVARISNGMNCQNCHLEAGTRAWGNNFSAVASSYPRFGPRRGASETIADRIIDCFERSLNGGAPDSSSLEMAAMVAYIQWVGKGVAKGVKPPGAGTRKLAYLDRPANPENGKAVYMRQCSRCHGPGGAGVPNADTTAYLYPPLWGRASYNTAAGLYRLGSFAGYIKNNMPFGVTYQRPQLTDEEAWDLAAFVNSQFRPQKTFKKDWPDIAVKPFDYPFGPYADSFSVKQHKYGPFADIARTKSRQ